MTLFRHLCDRTQARLLRVDPDRLWRYHGAALVATVGLFALMQIANQYIIASDTRADPVLRWIQSGSLLAGGLIVTVQAIVIFVPTHHVFRSRIRVLNQQTAQLQTAKVELQHANLRLLHMSNHDQLTGLPNRGKMIAAMEEKMTRGQALDHCFLLIGLDGFKSINDSAGHAAGDQVLCAVGRALQFCVDDDHLVARIGGDEFAMLTDEPAAFMLPRIKAALGDGFDVSGRNLKITASIGYLVLDASRTDPMSVLSDATMALQAAKMDGGHRGFPFTPELRENAGQMQRLQLDLPGAIRNGELVPWFQPQVRLTDGGLHGVEVLARWQHPTRGLLTPDRFLPVAERAGMMIEMDHAIWQSAMAHAMGWQQAQIWHPLISLNAAPDTISDPYLIERLLLGMRNSGLAADQVIVEVLETTLINGADDMAAINIDTLAECGIALELDDFGTGYASLSRLTQLPLSGIKLDKSLVAPLPDQGADSVVRAILALAAELGLHVVAEGVEEHGQAQHLIDRGCDVGQGYGFARPMPPREFETWLRKHANRPVTIDGAPLALAKQA